MDKMRARHTPSADPHKPAGVEWHVVHDDKAVALCGVNVEGGSERPIADWATVTDPRCRHCGDAYSNEA
ncbi:hypothetical protein [Yinghuangia seranimata]|uniref:hypothetical protein n=1 Tax=Yinghuangia seranimata TaxID=408067 RepID=UPI00248B0551|nr:hypothetical protein [Yinghuangia seranimata]MDI2126421.1 hypothetical protein [Yinghuangia seranimata]